MASIAVLHVKAQAIRLSSIATAVMTRVEAIFRTQIPQIKQIRRINLCNLWIPV